MVAAALIAARDLLLAAILLAALLLAVRVAIFGDLGSALGAIGVWGFAMAFALNAPPVRPEAPRLRAVAPSLQATRVSGSPRANARPLEAYAP